MWIATVVQSSEDASESKGAPLATVYKEEKVPESKKGDAIHRSRHDTVKGSGAEHEYKTEVHHYKPSSSPLETILAAEKAYNAELEASYAADEAKEATFLAIVAAQTAEATLADIRYRFQEAEQYAQEAQAHALQAVNAANAAQATQAAHKAQVAAATAQALLNQHPKAYGSVH